MKKFTLLTTFFLSSSLFSAIEILDRVAVIVEDGLIMESQIKRRLCLLFFCLYIVHSQNDLFI